MNKYLFLIILFSSCKTANSNKILEIEFCFEENFKDAQSLPIYGYAPSKMCHLVASVTIHDTLYLPIIEEEEPNCCFFEFNLEKTRFTATCFSPYFNSKGDFLILKPSVEYNILKSADNHNVTITSFSAYSVTKTGRWIYEDKKTKQKDTIIYQPIIKYQE